MMNLLDGGGGGRSGLLSWYMQCFIRVIELRNVACLLASLKTEVRFSETRCEPDPDLVTVHNKNLPMQYTENFSALKIENFVGEISIFLKFLLKTLIVGTR